MAQPPIAIVGAGLAGLTVARSLFVQNIPFILYDKSPQLPRKNHAITLYESTWKALLPLLNLDAQSFRSRVAVDAPLGGQGSLSSATDIRVHRSSLDSLLGTGLNPVFRSGHNLKGVIFSSDAEKGRIRLRFEDGAEALHSLVVAADGVHSAVRSSILPKVKLAVLPYVVITGVRKVSLGDRESPLVQLFDGRSICSYSLQLQDNVLLRLGIDGVDAEKKNMYLRYTFSRPAKEDGSSDPLYNPDRSKEEATRIPDTFFQEISASREHIHHDDPKVSAAYLEIFDPSLIRNDRLLSWLMRAGLPLPDLQSLSDLESKGVAFVGDSVHAHPILGGSGANEAIMDALQSASRLKNADPMALQGWHKGKYAEWASGLQGATKSIGAMHDDRQKSVL